MTAERPADDMAAAEDEWDELVNAARAEGHVQGRAEVAAAVGDLADELAEQDGNRGIAAVLRAALAAAPAEAVGDDHA